MDVAEQVQQLREAWRIKDDALRYLSNTEDLQRERWDKLRGVIQDAGNQYASMRIDVVEERFRDQGSPLWLEVLLTVGLGLFPLSALTGKFLNAMTTSTQKILTHADRSLQKTYEGYLKLSGSKLLAEESRRIGARIKRTEDMHVQFAKSLELVRDPILVTSLKVVRDDFKQTVSKHLFMQDSERKMVQHPDAPIVVVTQSLRRWIEAQIRVERIARQKIEVKLQDLCEIAISPTPGKEAKAKDAEAIKEASSGSKWHGLIGPPNPLPNTNKTALDQLTELRNGLALDPAEDPGDMKEYDLRDLMLGIESMIWATTYDFTPIVRWRDPNAPWEGGNVRAMNVLLVSEKAPAPLPEDLWKRLIERYSDPRDAEGQTFKNAGNSSNLAGVMGPPDPRSELYSPEYRLSHYFSQVLYPAIDKGNEEMRNKLSSL